MNEETAKELLNHVAEQMRCECTSECSNCECSSQEQFENEIMTGRKWVEFGKMLNNMTIEGINVSLMSYFDKEGTITYYIDSDLGCSDDYLTPYSAIKEIYFGEFLEFEELEDMNLDLPPELEEELYVQSDKEGITIDELVIRILTETIEKEKVPKTVIRNAECCFNCDALDFGPKGEESWCDYNKVDVNYQDCCEEFIAR